MNVTRKSNKKIILSIVMALLIALSMMPGMTFASTQAEPGHKGAIAIAADSIAIAPLTSTVQVGDRITMTAQTVTEVSPFHVVWSSSNENVASISKKKAELVGMAPGTATITATLMTGADDTEGTVLATDSVNVTVTANEAYGFQGIGGQMMKITNQENIVVTQIVKDGTGAITKYINTITDKVSAPTVEFDFTMTAGMNNFNEDTFKTVSLPEIKILNADGSSTGISPGYVGYTASTKTIKLNVTGLTKGASYILQFGAKVQGNNSSKTLGVPIEFNFTTKNR